MDSEYPDHMECDVDLALAPLNTNSNDDDYDRFLCDDSEIPFQVTDIPKEIEEPYVIEDNECVPKSIDDPASI